MDKQMTKIRKQNMKIYTLYRSISFDLIFYYAIELLFLTQVKHISASDVVLSQAIYAIFILLIIFCNGLKMLIFAQFISALCFSFKEISDTALIHYSIPETKKEGEIYSRLEGRASKNYYIINAITAISSGFLYVINPYIPMVGSLIFVLLSLIIALGFKDIEQKSESQSMKKYFEDLVDGVKFITNSQRLRSLFLYSGIAWGVFALISTYRASLLIDIGASEQFITIVAGIVGIAASIGSEKQLQFHKHFRNKTLTVILYMLTFSIWIAGIVGMFAVSNVITLTIIIICFIVIDFAKGMNGVLSTRYLGNFADEKILTQIYAINQMVRNIFKAIIGFIGAYLLNIANTSNSLIILGIILLVTVLGLTSYMKTRVGLKPEEYDKKEIYNL